MTNKNYTLLQGLLRSDVSVASIIEKYKLEVNRSKRYPNLVQFKYSQTESDLGDELVQQCRGIIFDENDNWNIIARPFDKFFNYGEENAAKVDWDTARVMEKLDGTCCILYYYDTGWHVATLGSADASGSVHGFAGMTFKDLFWSTFTNCGYKVPDAMWAGVTFIFELTTPYNRVVVPHTTKKLRLIGSRMFTGEESSLKGTGYETPKTFDLKSIADCQETFEKLDGLYNEGYVVVDGTYKRIKIKHPKYVAIHHLRESFTLRNIVHLVRMGESMEFLQYFPEHTKLVNMIRSSYFDLYEKIQLLYMEHYRIESQKDFAEAVKDYPFSGVLFALRAKKASSVVEALKRPHIDNLISWMETPKKLDAAA